jgi:D-beta-D-heptose 7-phosphate kinase/D-beta-D-heptose 1-phosphate adenosyltransferase
MSLPRKVVIISGYFSPSHEGHVEYTRLAKEFAGPDGIVYVIVNSDYQSILKKGFSFVPEKDRLAVMGNLKYVDKAFLSIDRDRTVRETIEWLCDNAEFKPTHFCNGGDVTPNSPCPEEASCRKHGIELVYGLGDKIQSSSWILDKSVKEAYNILFGST